MSAVFFAHDYRFQTTEDQKKYINVFYCQGGFNYEKMKAPSRLAMKILKDRCSVITTRKDSLHL